MPTINQVSHFLDTIAPTRLAEDWDNVGLLVGDDSASASSIMTCLTITPESAAEALRNKADLIITHHPLPFRSLKRITTAQTGTRLLYELIRGGVAIYSPHTGFDSAREGINQLLADRFGLSEVRPLAPIPNDPDLLGAGRCGALEKPVPLHAFIDKVKTDFGLDYLQFVGKEDSQVRHVGIACGAGGSFLDDAVLSGCDTFVTGESSFHGCLEAEARDVSLVLLGHFCSERFAIEDLATRLQAEFKDAKIWASTEESDPIKWR